MNHRESIGKRLAEERKRLSLTQAELAKACGITSTTQFLYERGDRVPNAEYLRLIMELGVRVRYVLDGSVDDLSIPPQELRRLYVLCDHRCRDSAGRLSDLETRADTFEKLVQEYLRSTPLEAQ